MNDQSQIKENLPIKNFKWPVVLSKEIHVPADRLWETISMPGNLEYCHPYCTRNTVIEWPGINSRDVLEYQNGFTLVRQFYKWIEGVGYDLEIGRAGGRKSKVSWRIKAKSPKSSELTIAIYPHVLQNMPLIIRWAAHYFRVRPKLKKYLSSVLQGFDWYLSTVEKVKPNQFGKHEWFS